MPGFSRFAHVMKYTLIFCYIKIKIDFHPPIMCMSGHRIPDAALVQHRKAHYQLAALNSFLMNILVNSALICGMGITQVHFHGRLAVHQCRWMLGMSRRRQYKEDGGILDGFASKLNSFHSFSEVQAIQLLQDMCFSICGNFTSLTHVDDTHLPSFQEEFRAEIVI